ncbi:hypothetical protein BTVI_47526 [Pitangus sulphuratus]|nr:hypothetical protein BTVI_47526 [Pitangus sulphuratus]
MTYRLAFSKEQGYRKAKDFGEAGNVKPRVAPHHQRQIETVFTSEDPGKVFPPSSLRIGFFSSDINSGIRCILDKFADDTKMICAADTRGKQDMIQRDLDKLQKWAHKSLTKFNKAKCKVPEDHNYVTPKLSFLQAEKSQFSQPLLIGEVFYPSNQLGGLLCFNMTLSFPELDAASRASDHRGTLGTSLPVRANLEIVKSLVIIPPPQKSMYSGRQYPPSLVPETGDCWKGRKKRPERGISMYCAQEDVFRHQDKPAIHFAFLKEMRYGYV